MAGVTALQSPISICDLPFEDIVLYRSGEGGSARWHAQLLSTTYG